MPCRTSVAWHRLASISSRPRCTVATRHSIPGSSPASCPPSWARTSRAAANPAPPRPAEDASSHPLALELDELTARLGGADLQNLDDDELVTLRSELRLFEQARSRERRELFGRIDALSAELVRRYREGEADIEGLMADE